MTKPDFEKIFASGGTTLPLTDSQFLQGFAYLGENPPTKEEFNWLFQQLCLKMQWLNQNAGFGRWQADHTYVVGEICFSSVIGDYRFAECTIGGQSGTVEPTWGAVGSTVTDGGITWVVRDLRQGTSIGKIPALVDVGSGKAGLPSVSGKLLTDISGEQIGTIKPWLVTVVPAGWLACDTGALVSRATYPELWTWVQANAPLISEADWQAQAAAQTSVGAYSTGDGSTTFRLPRILDYVRGGLQGDVATWQGDAIRNITGSMYSSHSSGAGTVYAGAFFEGTVTANDAGVTNQSEKRISLNFDASKVVPTADENRPKTIKMLYCVKAFDATTNQGLIDITALANEMAGKQNVLKYALVVDEKAVTVAPDTISAGAWRTRVLNTIKSNQGNIISLNNNQVTLLQSGTYKIVGKAPAGAVNTHKSRIQNITDASTISMVHPTTNGTDSGVTDVIGTIAECICVVTITEPKVIELQHYAEKTGAGGSVGITGFGLTEIYSQIEIWKVG